jgi:hypothetical protein
VISWCFECRELVTGCDLGYIDGSQVRYSAM